MSEQDEKIGLFDSEYHDQAITEAARMLASFRLGLDADDPFAFNDYEKLCAGHIVGRLAAAGLIVDRYKHALVPKEFRATTTLHRPKAPSLARKET